MFAHREGPSRTREFIIFVVLSLIGLGLNEAIMWLGGRLVGDEWYMLTKVLATTLVMFLELLLPQALARRGVGEDAVSQADENVCLHSHPYRSMTVPSPASPFGLCPWAEIPFRVIAPCESLARAGRLISPG